MLAGRSSVDQSALTGESMPIDKGVGDAVYTGTVNAKVFLGDYLDFQVKVADFVLLARAHPSLRTPAGETIHVRMKEEKCVAIPEAAAPRIAA